MHNSNNFLFFLLVLSIVIAPSCSLNHNIPQKDQLNKRVQLLYTAELNKNWSEWSTLVVPIFREKSKDNENSFGDNFFNSRDFNLVAWHIVSRRSVDPPPYITGATKAIALEMDVTIDRNGVKKKATDQTDYWALIDGEWYWFWRGWPND